MTLFLMLRLGPIICQVASDNLRLLLPLRLKMLFCKQLAVENCRIRVIRWNLTTKKSYALIIFIIEISVS